MTVGIGNSYQVVEDVEDSEWEDLDQVVTINIEDTRVLEDHFFSWSRSDQDHFGKKVI